MKKLILLLALFAFVSCGKQPSAIIVGEMQGADDQMVYLSERLGADFGFSRTDSVMMRDGVFSFTVNDVTPRVGSITFKDSQRSYFNIVIEEGTLNIKSDFNNTSKAVKGGTFIADKEAELNNKTAVLYSKMRELSDKSRTLAAQLKKEGKTDAEIDAETKHITDEAFAIRAEIEALRINTAEENKDNLFGVYLNTNGFPSTLREIDAMLAKIPDNLRDNGFYTFLVKRRAHIEKLDEGAMAPDFTIKTIDGEDFTLSSLLGKVVLINTWASY